MEWTRAPGSPSPSMVRLAAVLAVVACAEFPLLELAAIAVGPKPANLLPAALVTAGYLPPFLVIVVGTLRGRRPRGAWWYAAMIALVLVVAASTIGPQTVLPVFPALAVASMLLVRPSWALGVLVGLTVVTLPLALTLSSSVEDFWYPTEVLWLYALVALVAAVRRLEQARRELADRALVRERLRIEDELRATVGVALADLAARGERIAASAGAGRTADELAELVAAARRALAEARRVVRGYQRPTLRAELETAATLLAAAGVPTRVELPPDVLPAGAEDALRRDLEEVTSRLLRAGTDAAVVLRIVVGGADPTGPGVDPGHRTPRLVVLAETDSRPGAAPAARGGAMSTADALGPAEAR